MPIQILPVQLANQIAAGEVVERPASVVKELVENSLDAGATNIRIDIENGGASLIRIRDNGVGIAKEELSLALARHATSKIASLEDLDAILSLGFRGEALASISSVSRLTLTSRPQSQTEAWQVYAQGRDMETTIQPASHPVGTTVEVANLFFNTPARRKFLRTDKTEFSHIDEVIRRIALAKPNIAFTLTHNSKTVRQYRSAQDNAQKLKRVAAICGDDFVHQALQIDWKYDDFHLSGWVATPNFYREQNDLAYCYINGRMVRDKVINHAIRQAYAEYLSNDKYPAFVLFIDLNPNEVDVNVHPTKHEVRFHQSRLIHDFICQGISNALHSEQADWLAMEDKGQETAQGSRDKIAEPQPHYTIQARPNRAAAGENMFSREKREDHEKNTHYPESNSFPSHNAWQGQPSKSNGNYSPPFLPRFEARTVATPSKREQQAYAQLIQYDEPSLAQEKPIQSGIYHSLALVNQQALLLQQQQDFYLLPLTGLQQLRFNLLLQQSQIVKQPLLIPVVFRLDEQQLLGWQQQKAFFIEYGFEFSEHLAQQRITLNSLPCCLRQQNIQKIVISLLAQPLEKTQDFLAALLALLTYHNVDVLADAVNLLTETEQLLTGQKQALQELLIKIDFSPFLRTTYE